ncbi:hypothetical protein KOW79_010248 [Hemibagrus wyckioides]|uniref:Secreted protein n=1 Tax=Hemibagrus wyckioides TaxID=337641 RepID=A0A9D3NR89_9TELE|nr:hypothetical protein KOW79_010248 [Hemibagrus wyckioides]
MFTIWSWLSSALVCVIARADITLSPAVGQPELGLVLITSCSPWAGAARSGPELHFKPGEGQASVGSSCSLAPHNHRLVRRGCYRTCADMKGLRGSKGHVF